MSNESFTPSEAAVVSGLPVRAVQKAIDEGLLARGRKNRRRTLTEPDLFYLVTIKGFDPRLGKRQSRIAQRVTRRPGGRFFRRRDAGANESVEAGARAADGHPRS